jgi:hypothetical protein
MTCLSVMLDSLEHDPYLASTGRCQRAHDNLTRRESARTGRTKASPDANPSSASWRDEQHRQRHNAFGLATILEHKARITSERSGRRECWAMAAGLTHFRAGAILRADTVLAGYPRASGDWGRLPVDTPVPLSQHRLYSVRPKTLIWP